VNSIDLSDVDRDDQLTEIVDTPTGPVAEKFAFLPVSTGGTVMVVGPAEESLARFLQTRYKRVVTNPVPLLNPDSVRTREFISEAIDDSERVTETLADLILIFFPASFLDTTSDWLTKYRDSLSPFGQIAIIECADRPSLPNQQLTRELLNLWRRFGHPHPQNDQVADTAGNMSQNLADAGAIHSRNRVFTDPDIVADSDFWYSLLEQLIELLEKETIDNAPERRKILEDLRQRMNKNAPATPPIQMTTARFPQFRDSGNEKLGDHSQPPQKVDYLPEIELRDNPQERLRFFGADYLRSTELLSILLHSDEVLAGKESPEAIAARILSEYGTRALTAERNPGRMAELLGVSIEIASRVVAILELGRRFFEETTTRTPFIRSPEDAHKYLKDLALLKKEHLRGLYLNVQSRLIHDEVISIGTLSRSIVHPREVFAPALEHTAFALILAHNHPSGDLTPSAQDISVTQNIAEAGRTLGIELLDHIIIGGDNFLSMKKEKLFT